MSQGSGADTLLQLGRRWPRPTTLGEVRHALPRLLGGGVLIYAFLAGLGLLLTRVLGHGAPLGFDAGASDWV